jgi:hypothetical protein
MDEHAKQCPYACCDFVAFVWQEEQTMFAPRLLSTSAVLGLALAGVLALAAKPPAGQPAASAPKPAPQAASKLSGPYVHENLTIFLIHGDDQIKNKTFLTLSEAVKQKKVIVHETKNVNELAIENLSLTEEVFVQAGDIVKGGQQDRVIAVDLIVSAKSGKLPIAAFCVESGRWTRRGAESAEAFGSVNSGGQAATKGLKIAVRKDMAQPKVWENVDKAQAQLGGNLGGSVRSRVSASSLQLTLENNKLREAVDAYVKKLAPIIDGKNDVIGYAFAVNGEINSADVYASHDLFQKLWPELLKGSVVEAIAEFKKGKTFKPVTALAVQAFLADAEKGKKTEKEVTRRIKLIQQETPKFLLFKCEDQKQAGVAIRKSYVAK